MNILTGSLTATSSRITGKLLDLNSANAFNGAMLFAMIFPLVVYFFHTFFTASRFWQPFYFLIPLIGGIAGTHVFATSYLYLKSNAFVGVPRKWLVLYLIPLAIVALNIMAVSSFRLDVLMWFMIFYVHYAMFHFGRQNLGVLSFSTISRTRRPIDRREKFIINMVTLCGVLAALKVFTPALMLDQNKYPFDLSLIMPVIPILIMIGTAVYLFIAAYAAYYYFTNRKQFDKTTSIIFLLCVLWYAPIYFTPDYPMLTLAGYTTAHGLQYLVFLLFHAYFSARVAASPQQRVAQKMKFSVYLMAAIPLMILAVSIALGYLIWQNQATLFTGMGSWITVRFGDDGVLKLGFGLVLGLTMAHYWIDQFVWRFKDPKRRAWLMESYPFLKVNKARA